MEERREGRSEVGRQGGRQAGGGGREGERGDGSHIR